MKLFKVLFFALFITSNAYAHDLGVDGVVFDIKEPDLMVQMQSNIAKLSAEELARHQHTIKEKMVAKIEEPAPIKNISKALKTRTFTYDPTFTVDKDYRDHEGNLIAVRGTKINPLDHITYDKELIFIDARDSTQVNWLKALDKKPRKIILIGGRPLDLEKELNEEVYYDQKGFITRKFNIESVPARAWQEGKLFKIEEVAYES
jgi:conjugal transfer pilus assembly protein TraW